MFDLDYKGFNIHIQPKDMCSDEKFILVIRNDEYKLAFSLVRKCNKIITRYTKAEYSIFRGTTEHTNEFHDYNSRETVEDLINEAKIIIDMLYAMQDKITEKVENKLSQIKFVHCGNYKEI